MYPGKYSHCKIENKNSDFRKEFDTNLSAVCYITHVLPSNYYKSKRYLSCSLHKLYKKECSDLNDEVFTQDLITGVGNINTPELEESEKLWNA